MLEPIGLSLDEPETLSPARAESATVPGLGERAASGFALIVSQTVFTRVVGVVGNIVLGWLLAPEHFGLFAMTNIVTAAAALFQQIGLREVLIHRQGSYSRWAVPAFWMSVAAGVLCAGALITLAPLVALFYGKPELAGLVVLLAISTPLANLGIVPETKLQIDLRFKALALLNCATAGVTTTLMIVFATLGFGAYALVLPRVIVAVARFASLVKISGFRPTRKIGVRRWHYMLGDSVWIFGANACWVVMIFGDTALLGRLVGDAAAGLYMMAGSLSTQAVALLTLSLGSVLLPVLSRMSGSPERQASALIRALRVLGMLMVPTCLLQAAVADPLIRLVWPSSWEGAIPFTQILSVSMALRVFGLPATTLFQSQGRFRQFFLVTLASLVVYVAVMAILFLTVGGALGIAIAAAAFSLVTEPMAMYFAIRPLGRGLKDVASVVLAPLFISLVGCGFGVAAAAAVPTGPWNNGLRLGVTVAISTPIILLGSRTLMRSTWDEAVERLTPILFRLRSR